MRVAPSPPAREVRGAGGRQIGWQERRPPAGVSSASTGGAQLSARSVGRQTMLGLRSIGVVILLGLLGPFCPLSALGKPFSLVAPKRMTICTSAWPGKGSLGGACAPSWILVDEPVAIEDLRRIEITHSSSHPNVKLRSEFLLPRDTLREELAGALGNGDLVALALDSDLDRSGLLSASPRAGPHRCTIPSWVRGLARVDQVAVVPRYSLSRTATAQTIRASLFATATAALLWPRARSRSSAQERNRSGLGLRFA